MKACPTNTVLIVCPPPLLQACRILIGFLLPPSLINLESSLSFSFSVLSTCPHLNVGYVSKNHRVSEIVLPNVPLIEKNVIPIQGYCGFLRLPSYDCDCKETSDGTHQVFFLHPLLLILYFPKLDQNEPRKPDEVVVVDIDDGDDSCGGCECCILELDHPNEHDGVVVVEVVGIVECGYGCFYYHCCHV